MPGYNHTYIYIYIPAFFGTFRWATYVLKLKYKIYRHTVPSSPADRTLNQFSTLADGIGVPRHCFLRRYVWAKTSLAFLDSSAKS